MRFFLADIENQLLQFVGDHHHVAAEGVDQFAGAVGLDFHVAAGAVIGDPAHGFAFFDARQFDDAAVLAHGFADALVALFVLHLHAADVGGNADVVGDENNQRVGIGILAVVLDGGQLFFVGAAAKKILHAAHEEDLKRSHQRGSAGAVENLGQIGFGEIEFEEAEVAQIGGNQMLEDGVAKALAEKSLIADEDVGRAQLARLQFADEALGLGKGSHQDDLPDGTGHRCDSALAIVFDCNWGIDERGRNGYAAT